MRELENWWYPVMSGTCPCLASPWSWHRQWACVSTRCPAWRSITRRTNQCEKAHNMSLPLSQSKCVNTTFWRRQPYFQIITMFIIQVDNPHLGLVEAVCISWFTLEYLLRQEAMLPMVGLNEHRCNLSPGLLGRLIRRRSSRRRWIC